MSSEMQRADEIVQVDDDGVFLQNPIGGNQGFTIPIDEDSSRSPREVAEEINRWLREWRFAR